MMKWFTKLALLLWVGCLAGCSFNNTRMLQSWKNPQIGNTSLHFDKIVVVAVAPNDTERRTAEDALVSQIGPKATASYTFLKGADFVSTGAAKTQISEEGFDGAVVVRWLGFRTEKEVVATPTYSPMWDHYAYSWTYMQKSTVVQWKVLQLETRIFSVTDEKLIWSGTTETVDPGSIPKLIQDLAVVVKKEMRKQGLLPSSTDNKVAK